MDEIVRYVGIDWGSAEHAICVIDAGGRRRDERVAQGKTHVVGGQLHQRSLRASAGNRFAPRVDISS